MIVYRLEQLKVAECRAVKVHAAVLPAYVYVPDLAGIAHLHLSEVHDQRTCSRCHLFSSLQIKRYERRDAEMVHKNVSACLISVPRIIHTIEIYSRHMLRKRFFEFCSVFFVYDELFYAQDRDLVQKAVRARQRIAFFVVFKFIRAELACSYVGYCQPCHFIRKRYRSDIDVFVAPAGIADVESPGCIDACDLALYYAFCLGGILHLFAYGHLMPVVHESDYVLVDRMMRHSAHRRSFFEPAVASGQCELKLP